MGQDMGATWSYRRAERGGIVEFGTVQGRAVGLPAHFHDEDQITFVLAGRRRFTVAGATAIVEAGHGVLIPAGLAHRSFEEPAAMACLNVYVTPGAYALDALFDEARGLWRAAGTLDPASLMASIETHRLAAREYAAADVGSLGVAARAAAIGVSREGFSRAFVRRHGMPPQAYARVARLNRARRLLRQGEAIAAVAFDTGFADQSHLGRCFRFAFGVTPGDYRDQWLSA
jgi:AraC-like DNA-binding protein